MTAPGSGRPSLSAIVPAFNVAIGSREGPDARQIGAPLYRHLVGRVFNNVVQLLALPGIEDSQCVFKMFAAAAAEKVFSQVTTDGWAFDVEALAIARRLGLRIVEVPIDSLCDR